MKTFSEYIYESSDKEYSEFLKNCAIVSGLTDTTSYYIDDLEDMIYANKPIDKVMGYFKKYDKPCAEMEAFAKSDKAGRWKVESESALKSADRYRKLKERYFQKAKNVAQVFSCIKQGDKQDEAIAKLVKLGSTLKYYDIEQGKFTIPFFDSVSRNDILSQIDRYKGMVRLNGPMDFNILFQNGRVKKFYF